MNNLIDIQVQIEKLQKQANEVRAREFDKTVKEILAQMHAFGITVKDLQQPQTRKKGKAPKPATQAKGSSGSVEKKRALVAAKYRGPNGETWSGRGLTPKWLSALIAQGQPKESFAINA